MEHILWYTKRLRKLHANNQISWPMDICLTVHFGAPVEIWLKKTSSYSQAKGVAPHVARTLRYFLNYLTLEDCSKAFIKYMFRSV